MEDEMVKVLKTLSKKEWELLIRIVLKKIKSQRK